MRRTHPVGAANEFAPALRELRALITRRPSRSDEHRSTSSSPAPQTVTSDHHHPVALFLFMVVAKKKK